VIFCARREVLVKICIVFYYAHNTNIVMSNINNNNINNNNVIISVKIIIQLVILSLLIIMLNDNSIILFLSLILKENIS